MCGLAGIWGRGDRDAVVRMLNAQYQRGPDGRNVWLSADGCFALGHDRLAIIDVDGGAQPMANESASLWAAVNGEIYNHRELRAELEARHTFRTRSDSEVLLHLFEEEGPAFLRRLDGMYALAIWGPQTGLFLARDPLGIKPLYYGRNAAGSLCFASEIKALVDEVQWIEEVPPGSYWFEEEQPITYFRVPDPITTITDEQEAIDTLDQTLCLAVEKRLMADVPLGVFLSGGLDSSLISAIVRQRVAGDLHSFSVGLEGSSDLENARQVASDLGTIHHERVLQPAEVLKALPVVVESLESCDPALVRSAIPTYFVSHMAAQFVKVVLSGEGADELFAGYQYLAEFVPDEVILSRELQEITAGLHNSNLQRVDRMTMAHGLEGRVPFLDLDMISLAFRTDPALKWRDGEGKWVLRKVAERYLRSSIVWRTKEKFAIGTGIGPLLESHAAEHISDETLFTVDRQTGKCLDSKEEWLYWSHFRGSYGRSDVLAGMGRSRSLNPTQRWVSTL